LDLNLNEDFESLFIKRCEKALVENDTYIKAERDSNTDINELQSMAEIICYKQGVRDAFTMLSKLNILKL